ncbi:MAG: cupin domain-containing protein [Phaeodactylibacter sp.]|nr:cupin domain-containing protein [Phaeodactylibacter sp.]
MKQFRIQFVLIYLSLSTSICFAQNPLNFGSNIRTADPSAHVWEDGKMYHTCAEYLHFNEYGTIQEVERTDIGVGDNLTMPQLEPVKSGVYKWADHPVKAGELRESREILEGVSPHFEYLKIHATTQFPGAKPGKAHANEDKEECIIVKEGKMKVTIDGQSEILEAGGVILLMPQQMHSIENIGNSNLTYYVLQYQSKKKMDIERGQAAGGSLLLNKDSLTFKRSARGGGIAYFDRPTAMCERFEMHITQLNARGPSHQPHVHDETEIILVLSGETEMTIDGKEYKGAAGDFYFMESQLLHGVRNATDEPCSYFAFKWK